MSEEELVETYVAGCADLLGVAFIIGISRGITVLMNDGAITDTVLHWGEQALSGAGAISFTLLVFALYLPLTILIPSSSGLATLSIPIVAPLGKFAGVGGDLVVTAFQSASGLVNIITPTAAVVMGALALGHVPYDRWGEVCVEADTLVFAAGPGVPDGGCAAGIEKAKRARFSVRAFLPYPNAGRWRFRRLTAVPEAAFRGGA
mgnify:CR=1 FL=1